MRTTIKLWGRLLRAQVIFVVGYLLIVGLLAGLFKLYRFPVALTWDFVRYSGLLLGGALIGHILLQYYQIKRLQQSQAKRSLIHNPVIAAYQQQIALLQHQLRQEKSQIQYQQSVQQNYLLTWSHEIKTPLTALMLAAENDGQVGSSLVQQQTMIIKEQLQLLLNYERLADFQHDLTFETVDLAQVIKTVIQEYALFFLNKKITLQFTVPTVTIISDAKWLQVVLEQIIFNAVKYSSVGGKIKIAWQNAQLIIQDHGIGITSMDLPRIFEAGFTGTNGRQHQAATGMGLYLAKQICNQLQIELSYTSQVGQQTTAQLAFNTVQ